MNFWEFKKESEDVDLLSVPRGTRFVVHFVRKKRNEREKFIILKYE